MAPRTNFATEEARRVGEQIGIDWASALFGVEPFRRGMEVETRAPLASSRAKPDVPRARETGEVGSAYPSASNRGADSGCAGRALQTDGAAAELALNPT